MFLRNLFLTYHAAPDRSAPAKTVRSPHVRDAINVSVVMRRLILAVIPCVLVGLWNTGYQANMAMAELGLLEVPGVRGVLLRQLNSHYAPDSIWDNFCHGLMYFLPLLLVTYALILIWERVFAITQKRRVTEGALATAILFTLTLPPTLPLWQAAIGISFGIVIGREIFGGTGMNFINPILAGRVFLYFAYPDQISSGSIWTAVDGYSGATLLAVAKTSGLQGVLDHELTWNMAFLGQLPGAIGETSTLACVAGGALLLYTGIASWRIVAGSLAGLIITAWLFNIAGSLSNPMFMLPWYWHLVLGGYAFGILFIATDPVTSAATEYGRWLYGLLIGVLVVIIRVTNPAIPEGIMFAILLANIFAPILDHLVIRANIRRRSHYATRKRY